MIKEYYRPIPNYNGLYEISNYGNVKSLTRAVWSKKNKSYSILKQRKLKNILSKTGYVECGLSNNGKVRTHRSHQLVAMAFLGHIPNGNTMVINHINFNKTDNRLSNLEVITNRENTNKKHIKSKSEYTGVSFNKGRGKDWFSQILINGKNKHLGRFDSELKASEAYQKALSEL